MNKRTPRTTALIAAARERAAYLESPIPASIDEQEAQARAMKSTDNRHWTRGSDMLRELADALETATA